MPPDRLLFVFPLPFHTLSRMQHLGRSASLKRAGFYDRYTQENKSLAKASHTRTFFPYWDVVWVGEGRVKSLTRYTAFVTHYGRTKVAENEQFRGRITLSGLFEG